MANNNNHYRDEFQISILQTTNEESPKMGLQKTEIDSDGTSPRKTLIQANSGSSSINRRTSSKKSRLGEQPASPDTKTWDNLGGSPETGSARSKAEEGNEKEKQKEGPDEKEIYRRITAQLSAKNNRRMTVKLVLELLAFLSILACLVVCLYVKGFQGKLFFGVEVWRWFALLLAIFSGMLVTSWVVHCIVFLIEWKFLLKKNVVYFTHGLKTNVVVFLWISVVLVTWILLFKDDSEIALKTTVKMKKVLDHITWTIVTLLIGAFLWLFKTTLIKILASSFHLNRYFERIQEAVFHHYVLQTLSGKPSHQLNRADSQGSQVNFTEHTGDHTEKKVIDWEKLNKMKQEKVPSWTMKLLVDVISNSGLSTMSSILNQDVVEGGIALDDDEITCEEEATATAVKIFENLVDHKGEPPSLYIERKDLLRFVIPEEVDLIYPHFKANEKGQVDLTALKQWVVKIYKDRKDLKRALNDNKTAVDEFNKLLNGILIVIILILWLLLTEIASTKILLFFSSQLLVAVFVFGNTCKTIFEALIFVFVMHPFDVGDRCVIDGTMMTVQEMNILTTLFLKFDNEKVCYPNAILSTKSIGNYYRSPHQGDCVEFGIDYATPLPKINQLKERIEQYLVQTPRFWHPEHSLVVKEIENINKIKFALYFTHTMNFQEFPVKSRRRSELILELKKIFDELEISYHLLPQEIHLLKTTSNV